MFKDIYSSVVFHRLFSLVSPYNVMYHTSLFLTRSFIVKLLQHHREMTLCCITNPIALMP